MNDALFRHKPALSWQHDTATITAGTTWLRIQNGPARHSLRGAAALANFNRLLRQVCEAEHENRDHRCVIPFDSGPAPLWCDQYYGIKLECGGEVLELGTNGLHDLHRWLSWLHGDTPGWFCSPYYDTLTIGRLRGLVELTYNDIGADKLFSVQMTTSAAKQLSKHLLACPYGKYQSFDATTGTLEIEHVGDHFELMFPGDREGVMAIADMAQFACHLAERLDPAGADDK